MKTRDIVTIMIFANDYHSGQWSRGYRLMCRAARTLQHITGRPVCFNSGYESTIRQNNLYRILVAKYADKM